MPDVIDVIKGLEEVKHFIKCENLPAHSLKALLIMDDAIALLKAHEAKPVWHSCDERIGFFACGANMGTNPKYCWYFGRKVKWDG